MSRMMNNGYGEACVIVYTITVRKFIGRALLNCLLCNVDYCFIVTSNFRDDH